MADEGITLATIGRGAAEELFQQHVQDVLKNVTDVNTNAEAERVITLRFRFKPDLKRQMGAVKIESSAKLAGRLPAGTVVYMGADRSGKLVAQESDPRQGNLFDKKDAGPNVVSMNGGRTNGN